MKKCTLIILGLVAMSLNLSANDSVSKATSEGDPAMVLFTSAMPGGYICSLVQGGSNDLGGGVADALICMGAGLTTNLAATTILLRTYEMANDDAINFEVTREITDALQEALDLELDRDENQTLEEAISSIIIINNMIQ